ncbi:MAG: hypothetical protein ACI8TP_000545 [Acidimicrobiales bacterium]|jgi:hypothetical protein
MSYLFFGPDRKRPPSRRRRETLAVSLCVTCPYLVACRDLGPLNKEHGIWGGETEEDRALAGFPPASSSRRAVIAARAESDMARHAYAG